MHNSILELVNVADFNFLSNYTQIWLQKQCVEYSHQILFAIICRLMTVKISIFYKWNVTFIYRFICNIKIRIAFSGSVPGSIKYHISFTQLFHSLWNIVHDSKIYVSVVPMNMSSKVLIFFLVVIYISFCLLVCGNDI